MSIPKPQRLIYGKTAGEVSVPVLVSTDGTVHTTGGGGGGGTVDQGTGGSSPWLVTFSPTGHTASVPTNFAVTGLSQEAVAANASRKGLIIINDSSDTFYIGVGHTAELHKGIKLFPGGAWEMDAQTLSTQAVNAISLGAGGTLCVQEWV